MNSCCICRVVRLRSFTTFKQNSRDAVANTVSYTHLDVYKRQVVSVYPVPKLYVDWEEKQALFFEATVVRPSPIGLSLIHI